MCLKESQRLLPSVGLGLGGTAVIYGAASNEPTMLVGHQLTGQRQTVRGYSLFTETDKFGNYAADLLGHLQTGHLKLPVRTYPFAEVQTTHRDMESRRTQDKVALLLQ